MGSKIKKIEGLCPYCGAKNSVKFVDCYYMNNAKPYAKSVPICDECAGDGIMLRKINNRRYKIVGGW